MKPSRASFWIAVLGGCAGHRDRPRGLDCQACRVTPNAREERTGYVMGDWATHREPGRGVYFWTITHRPTGTAVNVYPPPENRGQALQVLARYAAGEVPEATKMLLAGHPPLA